MSRAIPPMLADPAAADKQFALISSRYDVQREQVQVGGCVLSVLSVRDTNALLDAIDPATFAGDERLPYWAEIWPSSIELARCCLYDLRLTDTRVLDLGCGLGVAGIAAALAGAAVTMTDYEPDALAFARWNVLCNIPPDGRRPCLRLLDWRSPDVPGRYDTIIGSDIVYERRHFDPLLALLDSSLSPEGIAVFTDPDRETGREFAARAADRGFTLTTLRTSVQWRGRSRTIVRLTLRKGREQQ